MRTLLVIFLLVPALLIGQTVGKVIKITDGDTFVILKNDKKEIKVRFHGIDCPEMDQAYGYPAKKFTSEKSLNKTVTLIEKGYDPYNRLLAIVMFDDSTSLNEMLLADGWAWHSKKYDQNPKWAALADSVKANNLGLWQGKKPIPPWVHRRNKK